MIPSVGLWRNEKHQYWFCGDDGVTVGPMTSVTTALRALDKPAIPEWAKRVTAETAVDNLELVSQMVKTGGRQAAVDWVKSLPNYKRDAAADLGTRVHLLAEKTTFGESPEMTAEEAPFVAQYRHFLDDFQPEFIRVEAMVCDLNNRYAGTLDWIARIHAKWPGSAVPETRIVLGDIKTSSETYAELAKKQRARDSYLETSLQLAGLRYAEFMGWVEDSRKHPLPAIEQCAVLRLRPDGYRLIPYAINRATWMRFLESLHLYEFMRDAAKTLIGEPVTAERERIAA